jgi:hypothetical protein
MEEITSFPYFIWHYTCVPEENGIRRSKDLRAEIGKFPNSTKERKKMSIKTIRKRIAVIAISAVAATGMSLIVAPSANAAPTHANLQANTLYIATTKSISGSASVAAFAAHGGGDIDTNTQVGFITATSTTAATSNTNLYLNTTSDSSAINTALVFPGAQLPFVATGIGAVGGDSTDDNGLSVVVTGGTLSSVTASAAAAITLTGANFNGNATGVFTDAAGRDIIQGIFTINAAVGSTATISVYSGALVAGLTSLTSGTLRAQYQFTVAASSASGTYSADYSSQKQQACVAAGDTAGTVSYDVTSRCGNGTAAAIYTVTKDAYAAAITTATVQATATNGALVYGVNTAPTGAAVNGATTSASGAINPAATTGAAWFLIKQPTAHTAGSSVVTITVNGAVVATKTVNWAGDIATLTVDEANSAPTFSTNQPDTAANVGAAGVVYVAKDAAGNVVPLSVHPTVADATGALVDSTLSTTTVATYGALQTSSRGYGYSMLIIPANALSGDSTYQLKLTNAQGATIKSQFAKAKVSRGATNTFKASWNKATYAPGDIAELTITALDAYGNGMAKGTAFAGLSLITNATEMPAVGGTCTATSTVNLAGGSKVCKFSIGNTAGSYTWSVGMDSISTQSAVTGAVTIAPATTVVSNADVLKSIVSLIASINKQIQALQKLILKR